MPKALKRKVKVFATDECERIVKAAKDCQADLKWDLLILVALMTGMRRGELLNTIWANIDFKARTIEVSPKKNTKHTWD